MPTSSSPVGLFTLQTGLLAPEQQKGFLAVAGQPGHASCPQGDTMLFHGGAASHTHQKISSIDACTQGICSYIRYLYGIAPLSAFTVFYL